MNLAQVCWICGNEVALEECKVDERGHAVHEQCYTLKIAVTERQASSPTSRHPDDPGLRARR